MADVIREAIIKIGLEQIPAELKAPDLSKVIGQQREYGKAVKETTGYQSEATKATNAKAEALERAIVLLDEHRELTDKAGEAQMRLFKANVQVADGLFQVGRGFALLASSGNENMQKVVQTIAAVQGGIDLFRGSVAVIDAVAKAHKAAAVAAALASEAELALAASNEIRAAASLHAASASVALTAATLPISTLLIGVTAAVAAGATVWALWSDDVDDATQSIERNRESLERWEAHLDRIHSLGKQLREVRFGDNFEAGIADIEKTMASYENARSQFNPQFGDADRFGVLGDFGQDTSAFDAMSVDYLKSTIKIDETEVDLLKEKQQYVENIRDRELDRIKNAEELLNKQERQLEAARRQLDVENEKLRSFRAQIGALDDVQKAELKRIADLIKGGGTANREELLTLSQTGGDVGRQFAEKQFAEQGKQFAKEFAAALGVDIEARQRTAEQQANAEEAKLGGKSISELRQELLTEKQEVEAVAKTAIDEIRKMIDTLLTAIIANTEKLRIIETANANNID